MQAVSDYFLSMSENIGSRLKELAKRMERIKTKNSADYEAQPSSPSNMASGDAVSDFIDSKRNAQKAKIVHYQDMFNEWAPESNDFARVKAAMDFAELYADDFAKVIEVNPNGAMKKRIARDLYESYHSNTTAETMKYRSLTTEEVDQIIEVLISVSKGDRKFNTVTRVPAAAASHASAESEPQIDEPKHKHRFSTWNKATKAVGKH